jgi:hypothetical protein
MHNEVKLLSIEIAANSELSLVTRIDGPVSTDSVAAVRSGPVRVGLSNKVVWSTDRTSPDRVDQYRPCGPVQTASKFGKKSTRRRASQHFRKCQTRLMGNPPLLYLYAI